MRDVLHTLRRECDRLGDKLDKAMAFPGRVEPAELARMEGDLAALRILLDHELARRGELHVDVYA